VGSDSTLFFFFFYWLESFFLLYDVGYFIGGRSLSTSLLLQLLFAEVHLGDKWPLCQMPQPNLFGLAFLAYAVGDLFAEKLDFAADTFGGLFAFLVDCSVRRKTSRN